MDEPNISQVLLDEFREHRRETQTHLSQIYTRLGHLELTKAEERGAKKVVSKHASWLAAGISLIGTGIFNLVVFFVGRSHGQ